MKDQKGQDERVLTEKREIESKAFQMLSFGLLLACFIQLYFFQAPFSQYSVEFFGAIAAQIYVYIQKIILGNRVPYLKEERLNRMLMKGIANGAITAFGCILLTGVKRIENAFVLFAVIEMVYVASALLMYQINYRNQKRIEKQLDEEENKK